MKFVLVILCAVILVASSQIMSLENLLRTYDSSTTIATNEIDNVKVANDAISIPMRLRSCNSDTCNFLCKYLGYRYGSCISSDSCHCYN